MKIRDFLFIFFLYLFCASFPFSYFIQNEIVLCVVRAVLLAVFSVYAIYHLKKMGIFGRENKNLNNLLILLPAFLLCGCNIYFGLIEGSFDLNINYGLLFAKIAVSFVTALAEDLVFRDAAFDLFEKQTPMKRIVYSALIFGAAHLLNLLNGFSWMVFAQAGYTAFLGFVIGMIYEYSGYLLPCVLFHFLFNAINSDFFQLAYRGTEGVEFFIINLITGIIIGIYCIIIWFFFLRKEKTKEEN